MRKDIWMFLLIFVIGIVIGVNWNDQRHGNIWSKERGGLERLNEMMKNDKSDRLALVAVTREHQYVVSAISDDIGIRAEMYQKENK